LHRHHWYSQSLASFLYRQGAALGRRRLKLLPTDPVPAADAYNPLMSKSLILRRTVGTFLVLATVGLSTCQGAFNASLPGATISTPALESKPAPANDHG
jgi:hypothetical protein